MRFSMPIIKRHTNHVWFAICYTKRHTIFGPQILVSMTVLLVPVTSTKVFAKTLHSPSTRVFSKRSTTPLLGVTAYHSQSNQNPGWTQKPIYHSDRNIRNVCTLISSLKFGYVSVPRYTPSFTHAIYEGTYQLVIRNCDGHQKA